MPCRDDSRGGKSLQEERCGEESGSNRASEEEIPEVTTEPVLEDVESGRIQKLKELLVELEVPQFATYEKTLPKLLYDSRFTSIPKDDRRTLFTLARRRVIEESNSKKLKNRNEAVQNFQHFFETLLASQKVTADWTLKEIVRVYSNHPAWVDPALDHGKRDAFIKSRMDELKNAWQKEQEERRTAFRTMVHDFLDRFYTWDKRMSWSRLKDRLRNDPRYYAVPSRVERHRLFSDIVEAYEDRQHRKRLSSSAFSSRVKRDRNTSPPVQEDYRKRLARERGKEILRMLFAERVKNPFELSFESARDVYLTTDPRLREVENVLSRKDQELVFLKFVDELKKERLSLLEAELSKTTLFETPHVTFDEASDKLEWEKDKRFQGLPREDVECCFLRWHRKLLQECKDSFEKFLKICPSVTPQIPDHGPKFRELLELLSEDQRYKRLDGFPHIREELVISRLRDVKNETSRLFA